MWFHRVFGFLVGAALLLDGLAGAQTADDIDVKRPCTFMFSVPQGTTQLRGMCPNHYGGPWEIKAVACDATVGGVTVLPKLTRGAADSVLAVPLTCGTNEPAGAEAKGTPRLNVRAANGASCTKVPCDLDMTITAAGPAQGLISIIGTLTIGPKP
jgi:hypothetical protein